MTVRRRLAFVLGVTMTVACAAARPHAAPAKAYSGFTLNWGSAPRHGPYPLVPGILSVKVDGPDGRTPAYSDLESLQYHHHTRVAVDGSGRIWVAFSGAMRQEGESGMITEVKSSRGGRRWTPPHVVIAPPSRFDGDQKAGRRISYPRAFVEYRGQLYLVGAIDQANGEGCCTNEQGEALVAVALHSDGSIGKPFRVSRSPYAPLRGFPAYAYDPVLGPAIFRKANVFGTWGGSAPGQPPSAWTGYGRAPDTSIVVEPNTIRIPQHPALLFRLWRDEGKVGQFVMEESISQNGGRDWSPALPTNIPNSPSETTLLPLSGGDIAVIGNALDQPGATDARDPLYLAVFNGGTGALRKVYAVREGLGPAAYSNGVTCGPGARPCGAAYPGAYERGGQIYISSSIDKQEIWLAIVPSKGL
jgi:hypothetical protein